MKLAADALSKRPSAATITSSMFLGSIRIKINEISCKSCRKSSHLLYTFNDLLVKEVRTRIKEVILSHSNHHRIRQADKHSNRRRSHSNIDSIAKIAVDRFGSCHGMPSRIFSAFSRSIRAILSSASEIVSSHAINNSERVSI